MTKNLLASYNAQSSKSWYHIATNTVDEWRRHPSCTGTASSRLDSCALIS